MNKNNPSLDKGIERYYAEGNEKDRLLTHRLERERTLSLLQRFLPKAPAVILDVGGAAGVYAFPLAERGYEVHLIDPVLKHIEQAQEYSKSQPFKLASCTVGDARKIDRASNTVDVILFFGPLYHLVKREERLQALREAHRILRPGGQLFAVGISRFASFIDAAYRGLVNQKFEVISEELSNGIHRKISEGIVFGYLHCPKELKEEMIESGFQDVTVRMIEGPVWEKQVLSNLEQDPQGWQSFLTLVEGMEAEESILGASAHLMAIGRC